MNRKLKFVLVVLVVSGICFNLLRAHHAKENRVKAYNLILTNTSGFLIKDACSEGFEDLTGEFYELYYSGIRYQIRASSFAKNYFNIHRSLKKISDIKRDATLSNQVKKLLLRKEKCYLDAQIVLLSNKSL